MNQALLDRIRVMNKYVTNKIMIRLAGKKSRHFAVLEHIGRKSGKHYRIPIIAEPCQDGFVIALTYGKKVDWYENLLASGGGSLRWMNQDFSLVRPRFIPVENGLSAFPPRLRPILRKMGIEYFLRLDIQQ
ncbi:MAG: hypothetical protein RBS68_11965 [Anaerolineales bacterium]|jgi:deazaflavin-dependent oxidoreductase (nitroreductase family)|nr:hypothetical protein [Anaerolineales bacterium]